MHLLTVKGMTHYFGGLCAVSDFNLDVAPHELIGIIGPNGAGKTTLFNLITGVYQATEGSIAIDGVEIVGRTPHQITTLGIARTFQNIRLFKELSVLDNVRVAHYGQVDYSPMEALLRIGRYGREEQRIIDHAMALLSAFKLDDVVHIRAKNLPYGLQRRLEIARALATRPKLLLLDEPAAGMNQGEITQMMEFIEWVRKTYNLTILLIEHQMRLIMGICERIVVLDFGATIACGKPNAVRNDKAVMEAYLGEEIVR